MTVTAPAGYGKTSFLAEWQQREERATGWVTLSSADNDPASLVHLIAHACAPFAPDMAPFSGRIPTADGAMLSRIAPTLARALSRSASPFVLFLDELHLLEDLGTIDALNIVLSGVPEGSQVVLASRHRPLHYVRGGLATSWTPVTADDLRIDLAGAARIAASSGAQVSTSELGDWVEQCGGWAAGLHMYAILSRSTPFTSLSNEAVLSEYLYQECLRGLPVEIRRFLLRTSILDILFPDLCDAVDERSDSARVLRDLEAQQLFISADRSRNSYRLHPLFREYLMRELRLEASASVASLHSRASQWFQTRGQLPAAIDHAIAAEDFPTATTLVTVAAIGTYEAGQAATLERWINEIGDARLLSVPIAVVVVTWLALLAGTDAQAVKWSTLLSGTAESEGDDGPLSVNLPSAKAMVRAILMKSGMAAALVDAEFAAAEETAGSPWRDPALQILGSTLLHSGDATRAREFLELALHTADARGNPATVVMVHTEFALLAIESGSWREAEEHVSAALQTIQTGSIDGYVMCGYAHAAAACVELHAGHRAVGEQLLIAAMTERGRCMRSVPLISVPTRLLLARAHLMIGDNATVRMLLSEIDDMLPPAGGREQLDQRIATLRAALRQSERSAGSTGPSTALTVAEQRVLPYLQTHLTRPEIAERLFVSRHTVITQIASIFRKLSVSTRSDAVARAVALGLLDEGSDNTADD